jgi:hypothetical protein
MVPARGPTAWAWRVLKLLSAGSPMMLERKCNTTNIIATCCLRGCYGGQCANWLLCGLLDLLYQDVALHPAPSTHQPRDKTLCLMLSYTCPTR